MLGFSGVSPRTNRFTTIKDWITSHPRASAMVLNVLVALAVWGLAEVVLSTGRAERPVTPLWPSAGLAVAFLYLGGYRLLPGILIAGFAMHVTRMPVAWAAVSAVAVVIEPIIDARILRSLDFNAKLERVRDPVILSLVAAPAGALVSALLVASIQAASGFHVGEPANLWLWWLRDWLGVMVTAPLIFAWVYGRDIEWTWSRIAEGIALLLTLFLARS